MKICKTCGMQFADDAVFCNGCGARLEEAAPVAPVAPAAPVVPAAPQEEQKEPFMFVLFAFLAKAFTILSAFCASLGFALSRVSYYGSFRLDEGGSVMTLLFALPAMGFAAFGLVMGLIKKQGLKVMFANIAKVLAATLLFILSVVMCSNC